MSGYELFDTEEQKTNTKVKIKTNTKVKTKTNTKIKTNTNTNTNTRRQVTVYSILVYIFNENVLNVLNY